MHLRDANDHKKTENHSIRVHNSENGRKKEKNDRPTKAARRRDRFLNYLDSAEHARSGTRLRFIRARSRTGT